MNIFDRKKTAEKIQMPEEIKLSLTRAYFDYKNQKITLDEFEKVVADNNLEVFYKFPDLNSYRLLKDVQRIQTRGYSPKELKSCEFSSELYENVMINDGRESLLLLAKHGDKEAQEILDGIEAWEERHL